jgi:hypothetical protein
MKSIILIFCFIIGVTAFAQDDKYMNTMKNTLLEMDKAESMESMQLLANKFERIAVAEKDKWHPYYYASLTYVFMSYQEENGELKDQLLDKAEKLVESALSLNSEESEIYVIKAMLDQARIQVDPMARGMVYSQKAEKSLGKAESLNAENPRIYYIKAMSVMYTPAAYGGGMENACPLFKKAQNLFEKFKPVNEIAPKWGKENNSEYFKKCSETDSKE